MDPVRRQGIDRLFVFLEVIIRGDIDVRVSLPVIVRSAGANRALLCGAMHPTEFADVT